MPNAPYGAKVIPYGYRIDGGQEKPFRATVPYLVAWADCFNFINAILGITSGGGSLLAGISTPHQFPPSPNLYAVDFSAEPCGANGQTGTMLGLAPGEFFTHVKITVLYEVPRYQIQASDDPGNANQLDPLNPITLCEQSLRMAAKMVTRKAEGYEFDDGKPVTGAFGVPETDTQLVLTFPRVPFLPHQKLRPYIGKVNLNPIFGYAKGALLFAGSDTKFSDTTMGRQGQNAQLVFDLNHDERDWNTLPRPDGTYALVRRKGDTSKRIFTYIDFAGIFT